MTSGAQKVSLRLQAKAPAMAVYTSGMTLEWAFMPLLIYSQFMRSSVFATARWDPKM